MYKLKNIDVIINAMAKQKPSWRDQTKLPLRYFFILIALILFLMRFVTFDKIKKIFKLNKYVES